MSKVVCVTGASGAIGSWVVKLLLDRGYTVHATVQDLKDEKETKHLEAMEGAKGRLRLFEMDLLDTNSIATTVKGCNGVIHLACPNVIGEVTDPEKQILEPAIKGTVNVLKAAKEAGAERVVATSSISAITPSPNWPADKIKGEDCWTNLEYCKEKGRGMAASDRCTLCNAGEETVLHCLRDCDQALRVWRHMGFTTAGPSFATPDCSAWLRDMLVESNPIAAATLWWIWRARCSFCMEHTQLNIHLLASHITVMASDLSHCFGEPGTVGLAAPPRLVSWLPRDEHSMVINVDGSVMDNPKRGGFGGCLRSGLGQWFGGFFGFWDDPNILHQELLAIYYGLNLAWDYGARKVECQSDSLDAVNLVLLNPSQRHMYASLIWDIKDILDRAWDVQLYHTLREGNACADFLAKHGAQQNNKLEIIQQPPEGMSFLLLADVMGVSYVRP